MTTFLIVALIVVAIIAISSLITAKSFESDLSKLTERTVTQMQNIEIQQEELRKRVRTLEDKK